MLSAAAWPFRIPPLFSAVMVFLPMRRSVRLEIPFSIPIPSLFSAVVLMVALSSVSVLVSGSYLALPDMPGMVLRSLQLPEHTCVPASQRS